MGHYARDWGFVGLSQKPLFFGASNPCLKSTKNEPVDIDISIFTHTATRYIVVESFHSWYIWNIQDIFKKYSGVGKNKPRWHKQKYTQHLKKNIEMHSQFHDSLTHCIDRVFAKYSGLSSRVNTKQIWLQWQITFSKAIWKLCWSLNPLLKIIIHASLWHIVHSQNTILYNNVAYILLIR